MRKNRVFNRLLRIGFVLFLPFAIFYTLFIDRIYPGVKIAGIEIGDKTREEALTILSQKVVAPQDITIQTPTQEVIKVEPTSLSLSYDLNATINKAYQVGRTGNPVFDIEQILNSLNHKIDLGLEVRLNEEILQKVLSDIAAKFSITPTYPSVQIQNGKISVNKGAPGSQVDIIKLRVAIGQHLTFLSQSNLELPLIPIDPTLKDDQIKDLQSRAQKLIGKKITINFENQPISLADSDLANFLLPDEKVNDMNLDQKIAIIAKDHERDPQDAVFQFTKGKVQEFIPAKDGIKIVTTELKSKIISSLTTLLSSDTKEEAFDLPVVKTAPKIKTSDVNNLGIKELIGTGESHFAGSSLSRIHNIVQASSKLNGTLIEPGQTFSFNDTLGDISIYTGYQQAYIIKDGKTVLGDGGGVCQVSTTLFRATLNAGLPIVERNAHAYRVHYYEEDLGPGFDATVYSPTLDLKFKNDTQNYILIQTQVDVINMVLTFELYGANDGRTVSISKAVVTDIKAPPPSLYTDDPTLPKGKVVQVDFAAWGAKVYFNYKVEKGGEEIYKQTFYSNFEPWQAKFLVGTKI